MAEDPKKKEEEELKLEAKPFDEFAAAMGKHLPGQKTEEEVKAMDDATREKHQNDQRFQELELRDALREEEKTAKALLPGSTEAETQAISEAFYTRDLATVIKVVKKAVRTDQERKDSENDGEDLELEGGPTTETGAKKRQNEKGGRFRKNYRGNVLSNFKKVKDKS